MAYKVLDLFSGAGGLSRGFYDAGYDVVLGVDFDEAALKTFKENHGKAEAMKLDLFDHSIWICSIGLAHTIRTDTFLDMAISAEIMLR